MTDVGVFWTVATGETAVQFLGVPSGGVAAPNALSGNGLSIVGSVTDARGTRPARWDNTVLTELSPVSGITQAVGCSQDALVIIGIGGSVSPLARWTSGGSAGSILTAHGEDVNWPGSIFGTMTMSDDGSIIIADPKFGDQNITYFVNGTPTDVIGPVGHAISCSTDGTVIVGSGPGGPNFWTNGVRTQLTDSGSFVFFNEAQFCVQDKTVVYGTVVGNTPMYWDSLSTVGFFGNGIPHIMDGNLGQVWAISQTNRIAVGQAVIAGQNRALKWSGTALTVLPMAVGWIGCGATAVSGDGSVVTGNAGIAFDTNYGVYWDASNNPHNLFIPEGYTGSNANGISRDGSIIFGTLRLPPAPPVPTSMSMTDLRVDAFVSAGPDSDVTLRWSDDAGASWSNGITQTLGAIGRYHTAIQYRRLGMSRNRVLELSWAGGLAEALNGVYVIYEIAAT